MQQSQTSTGYFLGDALGSVRQLVDENGSVTLTKTYEPYGELASSSGLSAATVYGYTGEYTSSYIKLLYLRSRYYSLETGRFLTKDSWQGDYNTPMSYNAWLYTFDNPINWVDRTGHSPTVDCNQISLPDLRSYCEAGNGDDNDLQVLKARFLFFSEIAELSKTIGVFDDGYWWAGEMLKHFLEKGGAYKEVNFPLRQH